MSTERSAKDQAMAARMKAEGHKRNSMRCPMCYNHVPRGTGFEKHLAKCGGAR